MKHFILLLSLLPLLCSCSKNREEKATIFLENEVKKILNVASTYESVETKVESAFASIYTDYDSCVAASVISKLNNKIESVKDDYNSAKSSAAIWSNTYDAFSKEEHRQAKDKMNELSNRLKKLNNEIAKKKNIIAQRYKDINTKEFVGWRILHRFRCVNSAGYKSL